MRLDLLNDDARRVCERVSLKALENKSVLITGASGIIGTHLLASLKEWNDQHPSSLQVFAVANSEPSEALLSLCSQPNFKILRIDLTRPEDLKKLPAADVIVHAAGYGQPGKFLEDPVRTLFLNTSTTFALFEKLNPQGKFLFLSTSEVYVGLEESLHREEQIGTTPTDHPRACYIEAKRSGEAICYAYRKRGVDAKIGRIALAYGPGTKLKDQRVLHSFIERSLEEKKLQLLDAGLANRTYCYVSDAVEMLWTALLSGKHPLYNIGGESRTTIRDLALMIGRLCQVEVSFPSPTPDQKLSGAPSDVRLDLSRYKNEFGKTDFVALEAGVKKCIEWQRDLEDNVFKSKENYAKENPRHRV